MTFNIDLIWNNEIACLHRIRSAERITSAHEIQVTLGMSITIEALFQKLTTIYHQHFQNRKSQKLFLTIDDGHKDVLLLQDIQRHFPFVQPLLFLTGKQLRGDTTPLPLTALYKWCFENNLNANSLYETLGFSRNSLKLVSEKRQRDLLDLSGINTAPPEENMVSIQDVALLKSRGWIIGYHGPEHYDLRMCDIKTLEDALLNDYNLITSLGYDPLLAWPEGKWNFDLFKIAQEIGFVIQFGLRSGGTPSESFDLPLQRSIWM